MRAWVLHGPGDFRLETVGEPALSGTEVLVAVKAAGICGSDVPRICRTGAHVHPLVPGHEFAGIVVRAGAYADAGWLGKRVGVFPLIPCNSCLPCQRGEYELCRNYSYLGSRRDGGFAEYAAVPVGNLLQLPAGVSFEEAALLEPMAVAVHAMRRAMPKTSVVAAVCGLGIIGLLLAMFLREAGFRDIFVIGNKECQRQAALKLGLPADSYCGSKDPQEASQWLMGHTAGRGVDVFFECVGKNETFSLAVDNTAHGGTVCLVGNPYSDMCLKKRVYWKILRRQLTVSGAWNSSFTGSLGDDWHYVLDRLSGGRIHPACLISHRFPLEGLEQGLGIMRDKTEDYVKVMGILE